MLEFFFDLHFIYQALIAGFFTWFITALGSSFVLFFKEVNKSWLNIMLSFAAGVMMASAIFSLLLPAIEMSEHIHNTSYIVPTVGFFVGAIFIIIADKVLNKFIKENHNVTSKKRTFLLVSAITLHNIPEGMSVGVAFAGASLGIAGASVLGAIILAFGIGLQNFPEGMAVSLPLKKEGYSRKKAFFWGQFSGMVEPIASVTACLFVSTITSVLPFLLSFSAGAMIGVVSSELIPEASNYNKNLSTLGVAVGFSLMMILDLALG